MNKTTKTLSLIVFTFFISQNLYSQLFINKIDNKDIEIVEKAIPAKCISSLYYNQQNEMYKKSKRNVHFLSDFTRCKDTKNTDVLRVFFLNRIVSSQCFQSLFTTITTS